MRKVWAITVVLSLACVVSCSKSKATPQATFLQWAGVPVPNGVTIANSEIEEHALDPTCGFELRGPEASLRAIITQLKLIEKDEPTGLRINFSWMSLNALGEKRQYFDNIIGSDHVSVWLSENRDVAYMIVANF